MRIYWLTTLILITACTETGEFVMEKSSDLEANYAILNFEANWENSQVGELVENGHFLVNYDLNRLPDCFGDMYMLERSWGTQMYVRFDVAPEPVVYPLVDCDSVAECAAPIGVPTEVMIPEGAREVEIWFHSVGRSCGSHWDSAFGANYVYAVNPQAVEPAWMGEVITRISRDSREPCENGASADRGWDFDGWGRTRSTVANACFQVWQPGVTDFDNPDLWQQLDVQVHYRLGAEPFKSRYVDLDGRVGNNARYRWRFRGLDPYAWHGPDNIVDSPTVDLEYYFTVNGYELRPDDGSFYQGTFSAR